jgi:uncharacterized protein YbjT (DUF2867 family)
METGKSLIAITGATGQQGGAIARELLAKGHKVRAITRKPDSTKAKDLRGLGAEIMAGDLDDESSLERAVSGAWGLFAVQNTWEAGVEREEEQGKRLAEVARRKGVQHLVYSSVASAQRRTGIPHFENKWRIEEKIRGLGFPSYEILRPVFFMENWTGAWFLPGIQQGQLAIALRPETKLQMIAVQDIGKYGLRAFEQAAELNRREIDIAGDEHTMPETAAILSRATGHPVRFQPPPIEEVGKGSADFAMMLEWFDRVGYDVDIKRNAQEYGIRPTSLEEWTAQVAWAAAAPAP